MNRLTPETAARVFEETLADQRPMVLQALVAGNSLVRAINGATYQRLRSAELTALLLEFATDFTPPQKGFNGATGLYAGEQDVFAFLIDPTGWAEIGGEAFAPGFFCWNSEVGKPTVGVSTFWFQSVCANHVVWDATEVVEITRKHTGNVHEALGDIRRTIEALVQKRDERKDGFAKAMESTIGQDAEEALKFLHKQGITKPLAKKAVELAREKGRFTFWSVVDALTRLAREEEYADSRTEADQKAYALLALF